MGTLFVRTPCCRAACAALVFLTAFAAVTATAPAALLAQGPGRAAAAVSADRDPLVDTVAGGRGKVDFNKNVVRATGYGAPARDANTPAQARLMARGAAIADALRTLAMTVSSIQVTATTTVRNYELQSDEVTTRLSALLQSPQIIEDRSQADGTAVVTVELPLFGRDSVASAVLPAVPGFARSDDDGAARRGAGPFAGPPGGAVPITPLPPMAPPLRLPIPPGGEPGLTPVTDPGPFTSVIVDCRGLGINAVMSPKLYDTTGREVYGTVRVPADYAIEVGVVGYPRSMAEALRSPRAGSHPLIVRALRVADRHRFHPVISVEDADRILAANNRDKFLLRTAVIFLVDPVRL